MGGGEREGWEWGGGEGGRGGERRGKEEEQVRSGEQGALVWRAVSVPTHPQPCSCHCCSCWLPRKQVMVRGEGGDGWRQ